MARGYLLHLFQHHSKGKTIVCGIGKLESGETFAIVDDREQPGFCIRASDLQAAKKILKNDAATVTPTSLATMDGEAAAEIRLPHLSALRKAASRLSEAGIRTYESDVPLSRKYLINRGLKHSVEITGPSEAGATVACVYRNPELKAVGFEPELVVLALDIETDRKAETVYAFSLVGTGPLPKHQVEEIHLVGKPSAADPPNAVCHPDEQHLLQALAERILQIDPDILTGWNVIDFDLPVLARRFNAHKMDFNLGRSKEGSRYLEGETWGRSRMLVYGRQVLDALHLVRSSMLRFEDFRLDTVAKAILGRGKTLEAVGEEDMPEVIEQAYRENREAFCEYCLEDSRLVQDILKAKGLIQLTLRRSLMTGLSLEQAWGSVAAFEFLYMSELRKRGIVSPDRGVDQETVGNVPGGLVLSSEPGLYRNILVFDFKSLYPSIIRTFNIDPLAHVKGKLTVGQAEDNLAPGSLIQAPNAAVFDRKPGILPAMLEAFFKSREQAKQQKDALGSLTYKILMNSFYGVMGTNGCRFASPLLAGAITGFGQYILRWAKKRAEDQGHRVLYADTDSLFVDAGLSDTLTIEAVLQFGKSLCSAINQALAGHVTERFAVESHLELEFEKCYRRFFLPSMRGHAGKGRAKAYAGLRADREGTELEVVGMEAVRRDWTDLAHSLQRELLEMLFRDAEPEALADCVRACVRSVRDGQRDKDLVYRKALRKPLASYTRSAPPHVKAAKLLSKPSGVIRYLMTVAGPQPVGHLTAPIDYHHYIKKQIQPIVKAIAEVCPFDILAAIEGQASLF